MLTLAGHNFASELEPSDGPRTVEGLREDSGFMIERSDAFTALAFLVHLGLAERHEDGCYARTGTPIVARAMAAMKALDEITA